MKPTIFSLILLLICFLTLILSPFIAMIGGLNPLIWLISTLVNLFVVKGILVILDY